MSTVPERKDAAAADTWDLSGLFIDETDWEAGLKKLEAEIPKIAGFKGTLGQSPEHLADALEFIVSELGLLEERLGYYVMLRQSEDIQNSYIQGLYGRYMNVATRLAAAGSWFEVEIQSIENPQKIMEHERLEPYRVYLTKLLRFKPHRLSEKEEALLARQAESSGTPSQAFSALTDADMDFGTVQNEHGEDVPLTQSSFSALLLNRTRSVREHAYRKFYQEFEGHKNTLAALYSGSVLRDKYVSEVRGFSSARARALFPDRMPETVYDNLIDSVRNNLPALHDYYALRAECLGHPLRPWDVYVSLVDIADVNHTWDQAVTVVCDALKPLGSQYTDTLRKGLSGRWADRYENQGKRSGAFSAGSYTGEPYILMNFKENVLRDVFTLAHEGGHSMHSWYSVRNNPFPHYNYTIFEAEVASTFNEQLLADYMSRGTSDQGMQAYLAGKQIDDIIATIYRQTMFAEFERDTHAMAEAGEPLTVDSLRSCYRKLMGDYFGSHMNLEICSDLEGLRIPHFYRAFYVYKYATGLSASVALSRRVLEGGESERSGYLDFLRSGGSRYPLESLRLAGVDMEQPDPVNKALERFAALVRQFRSLVKKQK